MYTLLYPIIKISWEKFGLLRFIEFLEQTLHASLKAMQNGILSIIHAINKPDCWQQDLILYLVSENELLKPNQFRRLEIPQLLPYSCSKKSSN